VKITDFGISKRLRDSARVTTMIGSEAYMAPEQRGIYAVATADKDQGMATSTAVDIWALGLIAWELVAGARAFPSRGDLFSYVVREAPLRQNHGSEHFYEFVSRALTPSAAARLDCAEAMDLAWVQPVNSLFTSLPHSTLQVQEDNVSPNLDYESTTTYATWSTESQTLDRAVQSEVVEPLPVYSKVARHPHESTTTYKPEEMDPQQSPEMQFQRICLRLKRLTQAMPPAKQTHSDHAFDNFDAFQAQLKACIKDRSYKKAEKICTNYLNSNNLPGDNQMRRFWVVQQLAQVFQAQGRLPEAESLFRHAYEFRRRVLGGEHHSTLESLFGLGCTLSDRGQYSEAEILLRQVYEGQEKTLGMFNEHTLHSRECFASTVFSQGRYAEAECILGRAMRG
jgi:serine/threonine protein kinase